MDGLTQVKEDPVATASGNGKTPDDVQPADMDASRAGDGTASADHLAGLLFTGEGLSSGSYTPAGYQLRLAGLDQTTDRVVHAHETHHAALNDSTAWGTALHVYARLPAAFRDTFGKLLDRCRTTHESYATFGSVNMLRMLDRDARDVLAVYPAAEGTRRAARRGRADPAWRTGPRRADQGRRAYPSASGASSSSSASRSALGRADGRPARHRGLLIEVIARADPVVAVGDPQWDPLDQQHGG